MKKNIILNIKTNSSTIPTEKQLNYKLKIRVYGKQFNPTNSHCYLIDDVHAGTSSPIGEMNIDIYQMTFQKLRPILEYDKSGGMFKRNLIFQEAMFIMNRLPNHFGIEKKDLNKYRFGFYRRDNGELKLINPENELNPIANSIDNYVDFFEYDIAIVPISQISPDQL